MWTASSTEFCLGEVHLWVSVHECLELVLLLALLARGLSKGLLLLIKHHFLNGLPSVTVEVAELRVFRLHLLSVYLDVPLKQAVPPVLPLVLFECYLQSAFASISLNAPKCLVHVDLLAPFSD